MGILFEQESLFINSISTTRESLNVFKMFRPNRVPLWLLTSLLLCLVIKTTHANESTNVGKPGNYEDFAKNDGIKVNKQKKYLYKNSVEILSEELFDTIDENVMKEKWNKD